MTIELKQAIALFMFDNYKQFQLINQTVNEFRRYIYTDSGNYAIGGNAVYKFIIDMDKLINE